MRPQLIKPSRKVIAFLTMIFLLGNVAIASALEPVAEVYYRVSDQTGYGAATTFENDLNEAIKSKLNATDVAIKYVNIMDANTVLTSATNPALWTEYSHTGWTGLNTATAVNNGILDISNLNHIQTTNSGLTINFFGYPDHAHKDFLLYKDPNPGKKIFTFEIVESGIDYHTVDGGGFLFNVTGTGVTATNGSISGYAVLLGSTTVNLYKFENLNAQTLSDETSSTFGYLQGVTKVGDTVTKQNVQRHNVKIITTSDSFKMWDNGTLVMERSLPTVYGESFGPIASYSSHGCYQMSVFTFNNIKMLMSEVAPLSDALHQIEWKEDLRYLVNVDDNVNEISSEAVTLPGIVADLSNGNAKYVGVGNTAASSTSIYFINNSITGDGTFIDYTGLTTEQAIDAIATYIVNGIYGYRDEIKAIEHLESNGITYASGDSSSSVTQDIVLGTSKTINGSTVTSSWTSSNPSMVATSGAVTYNYSSQSYSISLTETIQGDRLTSSAVYSITVKPPVSLTLSSSGDSQAIFTFPAMTGASTVILQYSTNGAAYFTASTGALSASSTSATAVGLTNNQMYYFRMKLNNSNFFSNIITATPSAATVSGGGSSKANDSVRTSVEGQNMIIGTRSTETKDGVPQTVVNVNESYFSNILNQLDQGSKLTIPVTNPTNTNTDASQVRMTVGQVDQLFQQEITLTVDTGQVQYSLPPQSIDVDSLVSQFGADVNKSNIAFDITISDVPDKMLEVVQNTAEKDKFSIVIPPIEFNVTATYNGQTVNVTQFSQHVSREIALPAGTDPKKITTAIVIKADGTSYHVPTDVYQKDGQWYARISSLTNSVYTLIYNEATFADTKGRWFEAPVAEAASRTILNGYADGTFRGTNPITRAEFAAMIVNTLGLDKVGTSHYPDVNDANWFYGAVSRASEYKVVSGRLDGNFDPNAYITRQEAMIMMQKAGELCGLVPGEVNASLAPEVENAANTATALSNGYADQAAISTWAKAAVEYNLHFGLIKGSNGQLKPRDNITRAEAAVSILRLLQKSNLIDPRSAV